MDRRGLLRFPGLVFAVLVLTLQGAGAASPTSSNTGSPPGPPPGPPWISELGRDHPLTGRIWRPSQAGFVDADHLTAALTGARFLLLGEKHDNADHHRVQAWVIATLLSRGRRPAVALEMLDTTQGARLAAHLAAHPGDAAGIGAAVGWAETGWPAWETYRPIARAALAGEAPILAANLPRRTIRAILREGIEALGTGRAAALGLVRDPLTGENRSRLRTEIIESHCNQLPDSMIDPMVTVMTARDAHMADVMLRGAAMAGRDGAVLIAGNGHVRIDHGGPLYLARRAPGERVLSLGLLEVLEDAREPADYAAHFGVERLPFDFVWFTPRVDNQDPCEKFAAPLRGARERHLKQRKPSE